MKYVKHFLLIIILVSCKANKKIIETNAVAKKMSARKVAKKHINANFSKKTVYAKLKVKYIGTKQKASFSVKMKIKKDKVIWLKGTKLITVFKAKITPTSVRYYSPYQKNYFEGDFSMIKKLLGTDINFNQLQNMLLGQAIFNVKRERNEVKIQGNTFVLSPKKQTDLFDVFFFINPSHFKLDKQSLVNVEKNQRLDILYPKYSLKDNEVFPDKIIIKAKKNKKLTVIDITVKSVVFDTKLNTSFKIPTGYKRIDL